MMPARSSACLHCCAAHRCGTADLCFDRRSFIAGAGLALAGLSSLHAVGAAPEARHIDPIRLPLRVQPVLVYELFTRKEATSWRPWGGVQTQQDVESERERIRRELSDLEAASEFPLEILPLVSVQNPEEAGRVARGNYDALVMYAAGGSVSTLEALVNPDKWTLVFLRHRSGPVYLWYEIVSNRFLRKTVDDFGQPGVTTRDVVVDRPEELLWRFRSLSGLRNTLGKRVVCVGGAAGWGRGGEAAPRLTRENFGMELIEVSYDDLSRRLQQRQADQALVSHCNDQAQHYLRETGVRLETAENFVSRAFLLTEVFHDLLAEYQTDAITINACMGTIMQVSGTTACLPLSLLNDSGYMAFCESDFVVIPSGILLHYLSGKPVFLNDPTYAHDGIVTLAHCTAPRRMDGQELAPVRVMTHFESDWGAAPKVEMKLGQQITVVDPDFKFERWMGFLGEIVANPFLDICRSQIDVEFTCDTERLNAETRGFHWMAAYGDYLKEAGYALEKIGIDWLRLT